MHCRLLMQEFIAATWRECTKFGMAIDARSPMMATTIMISTRVNPILPLMLFFITAFLSSAV
jgi:hypothetical protein